jgi:hypothetical protein
LVGSRALPAADDNGGGGLPSGPLSLRTGGLLIR